VNSVTVDEFRTSVFLQCTLCSLVLLGSAGGSWYDHSGAAADYLCLPPDPEWPQTTVVPDDYAARLYGAEYESHNSHSPFWSHSRDEDVPCAVCRSSFASTLMIPARTTCYTGWTKAYGGYLAAGGYPYKGASEYACVDDHPQPTGAPHSNDNGRLFFGVRAFCGSLQCPPYQENKYVACVVCLK
ncbi:uncharacterized protein LOC117332862, partial [Pecten maximus]|uniref:uncharacterized protein LOC117332862 n=1 Tax=Pecten maximus TaxID=6579 RepID=UPI0014588DB4